MIITHVITECPLSNSGAWLSLQQRQTLLKVQRAARIHQPPLGSMGCSHKLTLQPSKQDPESGGLFRNCQETPSPPSPLQQTPSPQSLLFIDPISSLSNSQYLHVRSADWGSIFCSATGGGGTKTKKNPQASGTVSPSPGLKETHNWNTAQSTTHLSSPSLWAHSSISPYN